MLNLKRWVGVLQMKLCEPVDFLPNIPKELLISLDEITNLKRLFPDESITEKRVFHAYKSNVELDLFLSSFFDYKVRVVYQVLFDELEPHIDVCAWAKVKYIYPLQTGDSYTRWWKDGKIILEENLLKEKWYRIKIDEMHDVTKPKENRIAVVIVKEK